MISSKTDYYQVTYLCGLYAATFLYIQFRESHDLITRTLPTYMYIIGGLCVGFGTRMGCGCTSGHGISGLARLSKRSFVAVGSFMATALLTANLTFYKHWNETDLNDPTWFRCNKYGGWILFALSIIVTLRQITQENLLTWLFGGLFGLGLSISEMINNKTVLAFLTFNADWDPSLAFVLCFGVATFAITFWIRQWKQSKPLFAAENKIPTNTDLDANLVFGELIWGVGWALAGMCPGK